MKRYVAITLTLILFSISDALADKNPSKACGLTGSYGYVEQGVVYQPNGEKVELAETGVFTADGTGNATAVAKTTFRFANSTLWLLVEIEFDGTYTLDEICQGSANFLATGTVLASSNEAAIPPGAILFANTPRKIEFVVTGARGEIINFISSSANSVASGAGTRQK